MDPSLHLPTSPGGVGLLLVVLAACGWFFVFTIQRFNRRSKAEGDIDQRIPALLDAAVKPWQQTVDLQRSIIDEERKEKLRAQDEREAMTKQFIDYATVQVRQHAEDLAKTREAFTDSQRRLYERVEKSETQHQECATKLKATEAKIAQIEQRQFNAALMTPVVATPAAPIVPTAPASFTVPAGGLNITPAG